MTITFIDDNRNIKYYTNIYNNIEDIIDDFFNNRNMIYITREEFRQALEKYTVRYGKRPVNTHKTLRVTMHVDDDMLKMIKIISTIYDLTMSDIGRIALYLFIRKYEETRNEDSNI